MAKQGPGRKRVAKDAKFVAVTSVEMIAGAIPVVGGVVTTALTALELKALSERLEMLVEELASLAARVDGAKVSHEYLHSPEFEDVMIVGLEAGRRTRAREKLRMIAAILVGAATIDAPKELDVEAVLTAIRDLSPAELWIAREVYRLAMLPGNLRRANPPVGVDADFQLHHLEAAGLITRAMSGGPMGGQRFTGQYSPTETFSRVMLLMEAGGWRSAEEVKPNA